MRAPTPHCAIVVLLVGLVSAGCEQRGPGPAVTPAPETTAAQAPAGSPASVPSGGRAEQVAGAEPTSSTAQPSFREVTIPAGSQLDLVLDTPVASDTSKVEDLVRAHLLDAVVVDGVTALPAGTDVSGRVTAAVRSGKVKGRARLAMRFESLAGANDERYPVATAPVSRTARATKGKDALKIGGGAAGGAVVGALIGGKKGAAIGSAAGGGAGTAVVMSTRGEEVRLARGAALKVRLSKPLTVRVPAT